MTVATDLGPCPRSVLYNLPSAKPNKHPVNVSFTKKCSKLERYNWSCCVRIEMKHRYPFRCE